MVFRTFNVSFLYVFTSVRYLQGITTILKVSLYFFFQVLLCFKAISHLQTIVTIGNFYLLIRIIACISFL